MVTFLSWPVLFVAMPMIMSSHHEQMTREHQYEKHEGRGVTAHAEDREQKHYQQWDEAA